MRPRARDVASLPEQSHSCISRAALCLIVLGILASVRHTNTPTVQRWRGARTPAGFAAAPESECHHLVRSDAARAPSLPPAV